MFVHVMIMKNTWTIVFPLVNIMRKGKLVELLGEQSLSLAWFPLGTPPYHHHHHNLIILRDGYQVLRNIIYLGMYKEF